MVSEIMLMLNSAGAVLMFVGVVIVVLQVVLFFKIWEMTNNVAKIQQLFTRVVEAEYEEVRQPSTARKQSTFWTLKRPKSITTESSSEEIRD